MAYAKRPYFRLQSGFSNGSMTEPEIYSLSEVQGAWKLSRRDFVTAAAALGVFLAGWKSSRVFGQDEIDDRVFAMDALSAHTAPVRGLAFTKDGKWLATGAEDQKIKFWELSSKSLVKVIDVKIGVHALAFTPDDRYIAVGGVTLDQKPSLVVYDVQTGQFSKDFNQKNRVHSLSWDPEGKTILTAGQDQYIRLWEMKTGVNLRTLRGHRGEVLCVAFTADGRNIVSGGADKNVKIWDVKTGRLLKTLEGHEGPVQVVAAGPDNRTLVSGGSDEFLLIWDRYSGSLLKRISVGSPVQTIAMSPNGMILATGSSDKVIRLWDGLTGYALGRLEGHTGAVYSVIFSPQNLLLVSAGQDQSVHLWQAVSGNLVSLFFDPAATEKGNSALVFNQTDSYGQTLTRVLPCSATLPAGAVCTCNCVPGTYLPSIPVPTATEPCGVACQCNKICTCVPVV